MATTRTPLELATNVLLDLNIIAAEETPAATDSNYVKKRYSDFFDEMTVNDEIYWAQDVIPAAVFEPLTQMMSLICSKPFGKKINGSDVTPQMLDEGLRILRRRLRRTVNIKSDELATHFEDF